MSTFLLTFGFTFILLLSAALVINYCKMRTSRSRHPLTTMCHKDGGPMCCSCTSAVQHTISPKKP